MSATDGATLVRCGGFRGGLFAVNRSGQLVGAGAVDSLETVLCACGPSCWVVAGAERRVVHTTPDGLSFSLGDAACIVAPEAPEEPISIVPASWERDGLTLTLLDGESHRLPLVDHLSYGDALAPLDAEHRLLVYAGVDAEARSDAPAVYARVVEFVH